MSKRNIFDGLNIEDSVTLFDELSDDEIIKLNEDERKIINERLDAFDYAMRLRSEAEAERAAPPQVNIDTSPVSRSEAFTLNMAESTGLPEFGSRMFQGLTKIEDTITGNDDRFREEGRQVATAQRRGRVMEAQAQQPIASGVGAAAGTLGSAALGATVLGGLAGAPAVAAVTPTATLGTLGAAAGQGAVAGALAETPEQIMQGGATLNERATNAAFGAVIAGATFGTLKAGGAAASKLGKAAINWSAPVVTRWTNNMAKALGIPKGAMNEAIYNAQTYGKTTYAKVIEHMRKRGKVFFEGVKDADDLQMRILQQATKADNEIANSLKGELLKPIKSPTDVRKSFLKNLTSGQTKSVKSLNESIETALKLVKEATGDNVDEVNLRNWIQGVGVIDGTRAHKILKQISGLKKSDGNPLNTKQRDSIRFLSDLLEDNIRPIVQKAKLNFDDLKGDINVRAMLSEDVSSIVSDQMQDIAVNVGGRTTSKTPIAPAANIGGITKPFQNMLQNKKIRDLGREAIIDPKSSIPQFVRETAAPLTNQLSKASNALSNGLPTFSSIMTANPNMINAAVSRGMVPATSPLIRFRQWKEAKDNGQ